MRRCSSVLSRRAALRMGAATLAAVALAATIPGASRAAPGEDAATFMRAFAARAVDVLADRELTRAQREHAFRGLLTDGFDIEAVSRFVLGRYWRKASPAQRAEYRALFAELTVATYARRLEAYAGETLAVDGVRRADAKNAVVGTRILRTGGEPIAIDWRLLNRNGAWRIVDVVVEGVSMALTQRAEHGAVIRAGGGRIGPLLDKLHEKTARIKSAAADSGSGTL